MWGRYSVEYLNNGWIRIFDRRTQMSGLYTQKGDWRSGDLHLPWYEVVKLIK